MINAKYVPPHRRDLKKKVEPKKEAKEIKKIVASVKTKEESPLVKTKNKPMIAPKIVKKWVLKTATPSSSVGPK